jgi:uncharacterized protein (DUF1778 family)
MSSKPRAEAVRRPFAVRLSPAEEARLRAAAAVNRQKLGAFLRDAGDCAAAECLEDPREHTLSTAPRR